MDDLHLTDHKGNTMARIECESLFVPNEYIISYPNDDDCTTFLRNESKTGPVVHIQDGNKNKNSNSFAGRLYQSSCSGIASTRSSLFGDRSAARTEFCTSSV